MNSKKFTLSLFTIIPILLYFFDLGNVNALRQGTEGFYLLITQEMFEAKSFLTPLIYGAPHWSKPPLQFWLPQPLYWLTSGDYLAMGRLSILLFLFIAASCSKVTYESFRDNLSSLGNGSDIPNSVIEQITDIDVSLNFTSLTLDSGKLSHRSRFHH